MSKMQVLAGTAVALVGVFAGAIVARGEHVRGEPRRQAAQVISSSFTFPRSHGPFVTGRAMSLAEAETAAGFHIIRPHAALADDGSILGVYYERAPGDKSESSKCIQHDLVQVAIDYRIGILLIEQLVAGTTCPFDTDPAAEYASMAKGWPGWTTGTLDRGSPALLIPRDATGPAVVSFVKDGVKVTLYAEYAPMQLPALTSVADTAS